MVCDLRGYSPSQHKAWWSTWQQGQCAWDPRASVDWEAESRDPLIWLSLVLLSLGSNPTDDVIHIHHGPSILN